MTDTPLLLLALLFVVVFLLPLYRPDLPSGVRRTVTAISVAIWVAFAVDYLARLYLSPNRRRFVRGHIPDLLTLAVPVLRPLRLLRVAGIIGAGSRRAADRRLVGSASYAVGGVALICVICAGMVLDAERGAKGATLTGAQDALWWAATTVTTVGYGDRFPVTGEGRIIGVVLMLSGIALLGVVTATIAAWFVERVAKDNSGLEHPTPSDLMAELREIRARLDALDSRSR
jgi:voltage-gated potassium channel